MRYKGTKSLKNVTSFSKTTGSFQEEKVVKSDFELETLKLSKKVASLLNYEGVGAVKLSGSFLTELPHVVDLPPSNLFHVLDMSRATYYRKAKEATSLEMETVDKLSSLMKLYQKGIEAFEGKEEFVSWLNTRITSLGDKRPLDLIETETGRSAVSEAIDRVEYNIYG